MLHGPVRPLIVVPVIRGRVNPMLLVTLQQLTQIRHPHTSAHDLPNTGHQQVTTLGIPLIVLKPLHVERLHLPRESGDEHGNVEDIRHLPLGCFGDIVPVLVRSRGQGRIIILEQDVMLVEPLDGLFVIHTEERSNGGDEFRVEFSDQRTGDRIGEDGVYAITDHALDMSQEVVKRDETEFGFDVGVFGQVSVAAQGRRSGVSARGRGWRVRDAPTPTYRLV